MTRATGVATSVRAGARHALRSVLAPSSAPLWVAAIVALGLGVPFVALGGLGPATLTPARASAGEEVTTSLYAVTVLSAELTDEVEDQYLSAEPGEDLLVVTLVLENLTAAPIGVIQTVDGVRSRLIGSSTSMLELSGVTATDDASTWRVESVAGVVLQPRVPAEVQIAWPVTEGAFPDGTALLDVYDARAQPGQVILSPSAVTWRRTQRAAQISMEVSP